MVAGVLYRSTFTTVEAAEDWETETRRRIKRGLPVEQPLAKVGGGDTGTIGNIVRTTIANYWEPMRGGKGQIANARYFLKWVGPATSVAEAFSKKTITDFTKHLRTERRVAPTTQNRYMSMVRTLAAQNDIKLDHQPTHDKIAEMRNGRDRYFTKDEFETIVTWMDENGFHRERDFFIFLVHTGARPWSEAVPLKWAQVKNGKVTFNFTKNGRPRTLPLSTRSLQAVENQRERGGAGPWEGFKCRTWVDFWRRVKAAVPGLDDTIAYTARHTCASWQVQDGVPLYHVQAWMGHTSPTMTQRYAKLRSDHMSENLVAFD
jgi:integrase